MAGVTRDRLLMLGVLSATILLPLFGAWSEGQALSELTAFPPPLHIPTHYPDWSWIAGALVLGLLAAIVISWIQARLHLAADGGRFPAMGRRGGQRRLPWWGWTAVAWTGAWWFLAWTRFGWFAPLQRFTFFPLWIGFIAAVSALTWRRTGRPPLLAKPAPAFLLFGTSALFWWAFEWLNRFVRNWHYLGVEDFGPTAYATHASLCFSTVLPAVFAVREWLGSFNAFTHVTARGPAWRWLESRATAGGLIAAAAVSLVLAGTRAQEFYAAIWLAPLALTCGAGVLYGKTGFWTELAHGRWDNVAAWALAALLCGFFWEMWNAFSAAKWIYTVPYVERWHLFEMPALGYAGYLGFGLECRLVVERLNVFRSIDAAHHTG